jgi:hypothetical protein
LHLLSEQEIGLIVFLTRNGGFFELVTIYFQKEIIMKRSFLFSIVVIMALIVTPALAANMFTGASLTLPGGVAEGYLLSIWGASASDIHAVGFGNDGSNNLPMTYHYDGSNWTANSPALPGGATSGTLRGIRSERCVCCRVQLQRKHLRAIDVSLRWL